MRRLLVCLLFDNVDGIQVLAWVDEMLLGGTTTTFPLVHGYSFIAATLLLVLFGPLLLHKFLHRHHVQLLPFIRLI